MQTKEIISSI